MFRRQIDGPATAWYILSVNISFVLFPSFTQAVAQAPSAAAVGTDLPDLSDESPPGLDHDHP